MSTIQNNNLATSRWATGLLLGGTAVLALAACGSTTAGAPERASAADLTEDVTLASHSEVSGDVWWDDYFYSTQSPGVPQAEVSGDVWWDDYFYATQSPG